MKVRLIRIGNSRGVRLPKPVIEEAGLIDEVEVRVQDGAVVLYATGGRRVGWAEAAKNAAHHEEDRLLDAPTETRFDREEWQWK